MTDFLTRALPTLNGGQSRLFPIYWSQFIPRDSEQAEPRLKNQACVVPRVRVVTV
jgi:hypothetical protein